MDNNENQNEMFYSDEASKGGINKTSKCRSYKLKNRSFIMSDCTVISKREGIRLEKKPIVLAKHRVHLIRYASAFLTMLLCLTILTPIGFAADTQITKDIENQGAPDISGDKIVWADDRNGHSDIYMFDLSTNRERQITNNTSNQTNPKISGDIIVWTDDRNETLDIYMYDLALNREYRVTTNGKDQYDPDIDGYKIVWTDKRNDYGGWRYRDYHGAKIPYWVDSNKDIYSYDIQQLSASEKLITNGENQFSPAISGNKIVWIENDGSLTYGTPSKPRTNYNDIVLNGMKITNDTWDQADPDISGNKIVWADNRNGHWDIYLNDTNERRITSNSSHQTKPSISGNKIVWMDDRNGKSDIYMFDLTHNMEKRITNNSTEQSYPAISGDRIVWQDDRNVKWDIYMNYGIIFYYLKDSHKIYFTIEKFPLEILNLSQKDLVVHAESYFLEKIDRNEMKYATNSDENELIEIYIKNMEMEGIEITEASSSNLKGLTKEGESITIDITKNDEYEGYANLVQVEMTKDLTHFLEQFPISISIAEDDFILLTKTSSTDNSIYNEIQYAANIDLNTLFENFQKNMEEAGVEITGKSETRLTGVTKEGETITVDMTKSDEIDGYSYLVKVVNNKSLK